MPHILNDLPFIDFVGAYRQIVLLNGDKRIVNRVQGGTLVAANVQEKPPMRSSSSTYSLPLVPRLWHRLSP